MQNLNHLRERIFRTRRLRQAARDCFLVNDKITPGTSGGILMAHLRRFSGYNDSPMARARTLSGEIDPLRLSYVQGQHDFLKMLIMLLSIDDSDLYQLDRQERAVHAPE